MNATICSPADTGVRVLSVRCELEPGDLEELQAGGTVWLSFFGAMVPWAATVVAPQLAEWERQLLEEATAEGTPLVWEGDQA